ncbi:MAG: type II secretion system minor pseudopilin GspJ [Gammaproteobacteria bacterium]|nr:type II secretion system minor pseudopilin GspJ [Gammaproteobacteria bacterium]
MLQALSRKQYGFTLLEVLLSLAIMTTLSLSGYLILDGIVKAQSQHSEHADKLRQLQRSVVIMDRDFQQIIPRTTRGGTVTYPMLEIRPNWISSDSGSVSFVRGGWHNPIAQFERSNLQLVAYRLKNRMVEKLYWNQLDIQRDTPPHATIPLFENVKKLDIDAFSNGSWSNTWTKANALPEAIRLTIEFDPKNSSQSKILQRVYYVR